MQTISELSGEHGVRPLCHALGIAPATYYRYRQACSDACSEARSPASPAATAAASARRTPARALSKAERERALEVLHEPRFVDLAPAEIYATLLDEGTYLCSERTMYRLLAAEGEVRERRAQRRHPVYQAPELLATKPNELWSWDITRLKGPAKWSYFNLYVVLDVFSRFVVGWMVAHRESATLAERLITTCCERQGILPDQLTIHADRGSAMTSKSVALLLADLGVTKTHSRPHVSNDNPYSESQFKTLKYRPDFPERFGSIQHARSHSEVFFNWYNNRHRHSGIGLLTPFDVHHGLAEERRNGRAAVLLAAYQATPERFVRQLPVPPALPAAAWINPPKLLTL
jgi:putative transposase